MENYAKELRSFSSYVISKIKDLEKLLKRKSPELLDQIGKDTAHKAKVLINQYWYGGYTPKSYQRTYSLRDSIGYEVKKYNANIYLDLSDAHRTPFENSGKNRRWGSYTDFKGDPSFDDMDSSRAFFNFVDNGWFSTPNKIGSPKNPRTSKRGVAIYDKLYNWINKQLEPSIRRRIGVSLNNIKLR